MDFRAGRIDLWIWHCPSVRSQRMISELAIIDFILIFCIKLLDNPKITEMARAEILGCAWSEMGVASLVTWPKIDCILRLSWWDELIFACWCIFRKAKSNFNDFWVGMVKIGRGHLVHETLKSAEWVYESSWSFTCFLWCHNFW